jgi:hypothetical protein
MVGGDGDGSVRFERLFLLLEDRDGNEPVVDDILLMLLAGCSDADADADLPGKIL